MVSLLIIIAISSILISRNISTNIIKQQITNNLINIAQSRAKGAPKLTMQKDTEIEQSTPVKSAPEKSYSVLLYFAEPDLLKPGERVFDVALQDKIILRNVDLAKTLGKNQGLIKRFEGVRIADVLKITLKKSPGSTQAPILSGVELIAE